MSRERIASVVGAEEDMVAMRGRDEDPLLTVARAIHTLALSNLEIANAIDDLAEHLDP